MKPRSIISLWASLVLPSKVPRFKQVTDQFRKLAWPDENGLQM